MPDLDRKKRPPRKSKANDTPRPRHVADEPVAEADSLGATVQSPTTASGLPVEEQIRKEWDPKKKGGLSTSLRAAAR